MGLTVAVQMDPIQNIRIAGDTTFALLLEAQRRGHTLVHYTPDRLSMQGRRVTARVERLTVHNGDASLVEQPTKGASQQLQLRDIHVQLLGRQKPVHALRAARGEHEWGGPVRVRLRHARGARAAGDGSRLARYHGRHPFLYFDGACAHRAARCAALACQKREPRPTAGAKRVDAVITSTAPA